MKNIAVIVFTLFWFTGFAGGFSFPSTPYSYARVYIFNTGEEAEKTRPEFRIYSEGIYAYSKISDGFELSGSMIQQMNEIFRPGVDLMVAGMSKCFIPRHGIIYFDQVGEPVASISICFECQQINLWSKDGVPEIKEQAYSKKAVMQAEKQFAALELLFTQNNVPVFPNAEAYRTYANSEACKSEGEMILDRLEESYFKGVLVTENLIISWLPGIVERQFIKTYHFAYDVVNGDTIHKPSSKSIEYQANQFDFADTSSNSELIYASIWSPQIKLPNGVSTGMSTEQVQGTFLVWDGLSYPASIVVNYSDVTLRYIFTNRTLRKIEMVII